MALHIQMSEESLTTLKRTTLRNKLSSIAACFALIGLGAGILFFTILFIEVDIPSSLRTYTAPADKTHKIPKPNPSQVPATPNTPSPTLPIIVMAQPSSITLAHVPIDTNTIDISANIELNPGFSLGPSMSQTESPLGNEQGGGSTLEGTFYDLKLSRAGAATGIVAKKNPDGRYLVHSIHHRDKIIENLVDIFKRNWAPAAFARYYQAKTKLYASNFFLPECSANFAPIAYKCADKCKPAAWVVVYRGKVRAPKSGEFRFVGFGDDVLAVRFNNKLVLEAGYTFPSQYIKGKKEGYQALGLLGMDPAFIKTIRSGTSKVHSGYKLVKHPNILEPYPKANFSLYAGTTFKVTEGKVYPIEILISETIGGYFKLFLLMEDMENTKMVNGYKNYDIFRTNFSLPSEKELKAELTKEKCLSPKHAATPLPPFNPDSLIWSVVS